MVQGDIVNKKRGKKNPQGLARLLERISMQKYNCIQNLFSIYKAYVENPNILEN